MNRLIPLILTLSLASLTVSAASFDAATESLLQKSKETKAGLVVHVDGTEIGAYIVDIQDDYIIAANREHSRIVIRRSSIDAVAAP